MVEEDKEVGKVDTSPRGMVLSVLHEWGVAFSLPPEAVPLKLDTRFGTNHEIQEQKILIGDEGLGVSCVLTRWPEPVRFSVHAVLAGRGVSRTVKEFSSISEVRIALNGTHGLEVSVKGYTHDAAPDSISITQIEELR